MYKITKEMLEEFQRVMSIRPKRCRDYYAARYEHLCSEHKREFKDDANNDAANCLLLSKTAEMIYLAQQKQTAPSWSYPHPDECEAVAIYKGRGKEKTLDWTLAIEMNDGNFMSRLGLYNEESAPKIEAQAVLYTIEWYLEEAGLYEMPKWTYPEQEAEFMAQFKDFELI
jgi:hypothetical protein